MRICIVSSNQALIDACRTNFDDLCSSTYEIEQSLSSETSTEFDLYIWDSESTPTLPSGMASLTDAIKIIVASKTSLPALRRTLPHNDFAFLQSPVTPLSLRVVLESAVARQQLGQYEEDLSRVKSDRDEILQELFETNLRLQEYDQNRTNFLARAIHDIRVPLMAARGYCGLLLDEQVGRHNSEQTGILEKMQRSLTRLGSLVEAMMDLGAGNPRFTNKLKCESASIEASIQQAVHETSHLLEKKRITLQVDVQPPRGTLLFDSVQIEQIIVNLLDNGAKFTPKQGCITIRGGSLSSEEVASIGLKGLTGGYRVDISDTGPGIDSTRIEQIFDEYTSYGNPMDRSGPGLGLAICRMIIQAHNGRIWASSNVGGATFSFVLPLSNSQILRPAV